MRAATVKIGPCPGDRGRVSELAEWQTVEPRHRGVTCRTLGAVIHLMRAASVGAREVCRRQRVGFGPRAGVWSGARRRVHRILRFLFFFFKQKTAYEIFT